MVRPNIIVLIPGPKLLFPSHVQHFCALSKPKPKPKPLPNVNCAAFPTSYLFNVLHFFKRLIFSWVFSFRNSISQKWLLARDFFSPATLLFLFLLAVWRFLLAIWLYLLAIGFSSQCGGSSLPRFRSTLCTDSGIVSSSLFLFLIHFFESCNCILVC